jgi:tetratricopeptide (TPR) repeat protein
MTTKRIIIILTIVIVAYFSVVIGKGLLLSHYRQKADVALFLSGDYKTAIQYYDKLISWRPNAAGYYYNRGDAFYEEEQYEKAISDYNKSLQLGIKDSLQTILRIALTAKRQGNFPIEEQYLQQLLGLSKDKRGNENEFWAANYHLGQLEFKMKNYRQAIDYYNTAQVVNPNNFNLYHRANAFFALGLLDSARRDFNTSIHFVKKDFVRKYPNSQLAQCDTCGFPFGSKEYELLTESNGETIIQALDKYEDNKQIKELNDILKSTEKNSR